MGEFDLIQRYMARPGRQGQPHRVRVPIGDDCAILTPQTGFEGCFTTDMLVEGTHFLPGTDAQSLGYKALAVNLSDLAAMGAMPGICMLSLAMPKADEAWLAAFMQGFFALADAYQCVLIGGDTTQAPITIINIMAGGLVHVGQGVLRSGARAGQDIWVSGTLGDAALGLDIARGQAQVAPEHAAHCLQRLQRPTPRIGLGLALQGLAASMIDLSDGMAGDLPHILRASGVTARIDTDALPLSAALQALPRATALRYALAGGDDYELLFTANTSARDTLMHLQDQLHLPLARIGQIVAGNAADHTAVQWLQDGQLLETSFAGYTHFAV
jgi:thiamine-monophosphate kinase